MLKVEGQRLCRVPENDWLCLQEQYKRIDVTEKCTQPPNNISALFSSSDGFSLDTEDLSILLLRGVCCHLRHLWKRKLELNFLNMLFSLYDKSHYCLLLALPIIRVIEFWDGSCWPSLCAVCL